MDRLYPKLCLSSDAVSRLQTAIEHNGALYERLLVYICQVKCPFLPSVAITICTHNTVKVVIIIVSYNVSRIVAARSVYHTPLIKVLMSSDYLKNKGIYYTICVYL